MIRLRIFTILVVLSIFAHGAVARGAGVDDYGRVWSGGPGGKACYFTPRIVVAGNFFQWPGDELLVIDYEGFAHVMGWGNGGLDVTWVTEEAVVDGNVKSAAAGDLDGDGLDETLLLNGFGQLSVTGSGAAEFAVLCKNCIPADLAGGEVRAATVFDFDGDGSGEAVVWMVIEGAPYVVFLGWTGSAFVTEAVKETLGADEKVEITDTFPAPGDGGGDEYYAMMNIGFDAAVSAVRINEQGAILEGATLLPSRVNGVAAQGGLGRSILMAPAAGKEGPELLMMGPAPDYDSESYAAFPRNAVFYVTADLNGDGEKELVFLDSNCRFEVHAARAPFTLALNGKKSDAGKSVRRLSGGRIFVSPEIIPGARLTVGEDFIEVQRSAVRLLFDFKGKSVSLSLPDLEESRLVSVDYIREPERFFVDAAVAAELLGFSCDWDYLSQTLKIKTSGGETDGAKKAKEKDKKKKETTKKAKSKAKAKD